MKRSVRVGAVALAACFGLAPMGPAAAQATDAFTAACNANPGFFSFSVKGLENDADGLSRLCSCLVAEFATYPETDLELLTKDVAETSTDEDRAAYGDYTSLEIKARDAVDKCAGAEGLTTVAGAGAAADATADMSNFDAACTNSAILLEVIGGTPEEAAPQRAKLCACLVTTLGAEVSTEDAGILAQDLDGSATDESRAAYDGYEALAETASVAFDGCFATLAPPQ